MQFGASLSASCLRTKSSARAATGGAGVAYVLACDAHGGAMTAGMTAFVFAGGGSLGAIQVGALDVLVRAGERPDFVVGASVGALNACYYAARPDAAGVAELSAIWRGLRRSDVFPFTWRGALNWLRGGGALFEPSALRLLIERRLPIRNLEDSAIPVHVVATSLAGEAVCLSQGAAIDAVQASAAIPIAFPPVEIGGDFLMDGAIAGNTPLLTAAELGATRIIVLQTGYACSLQAPPHGAVGRGLHALTLLIANQMQRDVRLLEGRAEVHVAPHLCPLTVSPFNFDHGGELIERSAALTQAWLESGGLERCESADVFDHKHDAMASSMLALAGMDAVSFFDSEGPKAGSSDFSLVHEGERYVFVNAANRDKFAEAPALYLPQYGGLCAFAMAQGRVVAGDPRFHQIVDGRLYFNLNAAVQKKWDANRAAQIANADLHWRTVEARGQASVSA